MARKKKSSAPAKSWHGRLTETADEATAALLASLDVDTALWTYDIAGSLAHAQMLKEVKLISAAEHRAIRDGLKAVGEDIAAGTIDMPIELEDIHMVIEQALTDRIGEPGRKLHTGRSRNDQIALDLRLWARDAVDDLIDMIRKLQRAMVELAAAQGKVVWPSYTHLQRAQPILAGHAVLAYAEMLDRDAARLADARKRINVCPLGSGAVAGTSLPIDRARTAELLGFAKFSRNSIDATADRDFLAELCFDLAMLGIHLSRWCEDWIIYSSNEFGMVALADAYCTSSSMMPQKKNADTLELIRGKAATATAQLVGLLSLMKNLPLAYNRDLQDDKRFAFQAVDAMKLALAVAPGIVASARLEAVDLAGGFLDATSLAEYLVTRGVPFREAHGIVGQLVAAAEAEGLNLADLPADRLAQASAAFDDDVAGSLTAEQVVKRYAPDGAGGAKQLCKQLAYWNRRLK